MYISERDLEKLIETNQTLAAQNKTLRTSYDRLFHIALHSTEELAVYKLARPIQGTIDPDMVDQIIQRDQATICFWKDGSKTVVKCHERDTYSEEGGLSAVVLKKLSGNTRLSYLELMKALSKKVQNPVKDEKKSPVEKAPVLAKEQEKEEPEMPKSSKVSNKPEKSIKPKKNKK